MANPAFSLFLFERFAMTENDIFKLLESWDNFQLILMELNANPDYVPVLMKIAIYSDHRNSWRAIYLADKLHDTHPEWIQAYLPEITERLSLEQHHGKKRHMLKLISLNPVTEEHSVFLLDYCLTTFTSSKEPVANRVHAMQILFNISESEPDIKPEILELIRHEIELHPTPGIRSRGKKLIARLRQQTGQS